MQRTFTVVSMRLIFGQDVYKRQGTKRAKESNEEHKRIVEALKAHDAEKAQQLANQHIMNTIHSYDRYGWDKLLNMNSMERCV